jgi:hypothetical protein
VGFCFVATLVLAANSSVTTLLYFFIYTDCCDTSANRARDPRRQRADTALAGSGAGYDCHNTAYN